MRWVVGLLLSLGASHAIAEDLLWRWGVLEPRAGEVVEATPDGLRFLAGGESMLVPWQEVRRVDGAGASLFEAHREPARLLWRGLGRMERLDFRGAEPLLEAAADAFSPGLARATAVEALLVCRLERNAVLPAVEAWQALLLARGVAETASTSIGGLDAETRLVRTLPPLLVLGERGGLGSVPRGHAGGMFEIWSILSQAGSERLWLTQTDREAVIDAIAASPLDATSGGDLVRLVTDAQAGDDRVRAEAVETLKRATLSTLWAQAWRAMALARASAIDSARAEHGTDHAGTDRAVFALVGLALDPELNRALRQRGGADAVELLRRAGRVEEADRLAGALRRAVELEPAESPAARIESDGA